MLRMIYTVINYFKCEPSRCTILNKVDDYYIVASNADRRWYNLGEFFVCDVGSLIDFDIRFLNDPEWPETQSNWCVLEKDGDEIRMFDFLSEERAQPYPVPEDQVLRIKNSELQKLLYQWQEILSRDQLPQQIKIIEKHGVFNMEASE
jgi:hypothetical protein